MEQTVPSKATFVLALTRSPSVATVPRSRTWQWIRCFGPTVRAVPCRNFLIVFHLLAPLFQLRGASDSGGGPNNTLRLCLCCLLCWLEWLFCRRLRGGVRPPVYRTIASYFPRKRTSTLHPGKVTLPVLVCKFLEHRVGSLPARICPPTIATRRARLCHKHRPSVTRADLGVESTVESAFFSWSRSV